jgi:hypothetical protein
MKSHDLAVLTAVLPLFHCTRCTKAQFRGTQLNDESVCFPDLAYTKLGNAVVFKLHNGYS